MDDVQFTPGQTVVVIQDTCQAIPHRKGTLFIVVEAPLDTRDITVRPPDSKYRYEIDRRYLQPVG